MFSSLFFQSNIFFLFSKSLSGRRHQSQSRSSSRCADAECGAGRAVAASQLAVVELERCAVLLAPAEPAAFSHRFAGGGSPHAAAPRLVPLLALGVHVEAVCDGRKKCEWELVEFFIIFKYYQFKFIFI